MSSSGQYLPQGTAAHDDFLTGSHGASSAAMRASSAAITSADDRANALAVDAGDVQRLQFLVADLPGPSGDPGFSQLLALGHGVLPMGGILGSSARNDRPD